MHDIWNPWHGCKKISEGCQNCYMYYLDKARADKSGKEIYKVKANFDYPLHKNRQGRYKIQSGEMIRICMTSDFFLEEADAWRDDVWKIIKERSDVKFFILTNLSNKANNMITLNNFYTKTETYSNGQMSILESYNKDGITLGNMSIFSENKNPIKMILYKSKTEIIALIDNGETKTLNTFGDIIINPIYFTGENIIENIWIALTTSVDKVKLNDKECYLIRDGNTEKFIDVDTGLAIKMIDNQNNRTTDYKYEFGVVKDSDVTKPNTEGYTIVEQ